MGRKAVKKSEKERAAEKAGDDEPPLPPKWSVYWGFVERAQGAQDLLLLITIAVLILVGLMLITRALDYNPVAAHWATVTARPTLPPTVTYTPTMTPSPTRTRFPTATPTPENRIPAMMITGQHHYGWHGLMIDESKETQALCNTYTQELCNFGFSAVNLGLWTGNWETEPQRFLVWFKFDGFGRYWYELQDGQGDKINLEPYLKYDHLDLSRGICVPALWNMYTTDRLERLNGLTGIEIRRALLGEAGVGGLGEKVSGIPDVLQLEIWDKPPDGCIQVIPKEFPAKFLPEWVEIEQ